MSLLLSDPTLAAVKDVLSGLVFTIFVISALLVMIVILLQEGKGGGLGGAFGGAAADAFGVKAGSVNRFTTYLAAAFLGLALLYAGLTAETDKVSTVIESSPGATGVPDGRALPGAQPDGGDPGDGLPGDGATGPDEGDSTPGPDEGDGATGPVEGDGGAGEDSGEGAPEAPGDEGAPDGE